MSIEIQFVPIIYKSLFENDKAFIVENENDCKVIDTLDVYATVVLNDKFAKDGNHGLFQIDGARQSSNNAMDIEVEEYINNTNKNKSITWAGE